MNAIDFISRLGVSLLPVLLFLLLLIYMDGYRLVSPRRVIVAVAIGALAAVAALGVNGAIVDSGGRSLHGYSRYGAPLVEELLKALPVALLVASRRTGFLVDAAIGGFAVGAGFAIVENTWYAGELANAGVGVWVIRGFGTAVMHGGTTCVFAIVSKGLFDRIGKCVAFVPGFVVAVLVHSLFNHFILPPGTETLIIYATLPPLVLFSFYRSDRALRRWLRRGLDADVQLLQMIGSGKLSSTPAGEYVRAIRNRFPSAIVLDMICIIRLHTELGISAKAMLMMRAAGFEPAPPPDTREKFDELRALERSVGRAGRLALSPLLQRSTRDLWQFYMLEKKVR